jgi:UDP-N-acetylmuramoylalanine--D-glutamate ligase
MMDATRLPELDFAGRAVTVVGLGIEGVDLARFLAIHGAAVTISDSKTRQQLRDRLDEIADLRVELSLGAAQDAGLAKAEEVFVSQGVPLELPGLRAALANGAEFRSMMGLFLDICPGPIVGITGSSGKTTTTALVAEMFEADERPFFVGGNIGVGLLGHLTAIRPYTWSVLEISHTQLQLVDRSPHVAAVLNITPNHLDRFSWDEYRRLKTNIIRQQTADDVAVLNFDDPECRAIEPLARARLMHFSMGRDIPADGAFVRDERVILRLGRMNEELFRLSDVRLRGRHNQANAVAAAAIAAACGISPDAISCAIESFRGVAHRLELVAEAGDIAYYNDSIATTPERTIAGLRSFDSPIVLLLGGRDKHLPLEGLAREASQRCRAVILFGESAPKIEEALAGSSVPRKRVESLDEAVLAARAEARPGDVVLLSPACTSYDAYDNFERRGEHFRELVQQMVKEAAPSLP